MAFNENKRTTRFNEGFTFSIDYGAAAAAQILWVSNANKIYGNYDASVYTYSVLFRFVCGAVEFVEQEEEHESMHSDPPDERPRIVALDEQQLERMHHDRDELHLKE